MSDEFLVEFERRDRSESMAAVIEIFIGQNRSPSGLPRAVTRERQQMADRRRRDPLNIREPLDCEKAGDHDEVPPEQSHPEEDTSVGARQLLWHRVDGLLV